MRLRPSAAPKNMLLRSLAPLSFFLRAMTGLAGALVSDLSVPDRRDAGLPFSRVELEREVEATAATAATAGRAATWRRRQSELVFASSWKLHEAHDGSFGDAGLSVGLVVLLGNGLVERILSSAVLSATGDRAFVSRWRGLSA